MTSILRNLQETEAALLPIFAQQWGIKIDPKDHDGAVKLLNEAMINPARAELVWERLNDAQRGAVQMLMSNQGKMPETMFTRLFGEIRRMGAGQIERERPHERPVGAAEALYYSGLVGLGYENSPTGARAIVYIPDDLMKVLPVHKTSYDELEEDDTPFEDEETNTVVAIEQVTNAHAADTSIVDDLTTLLAFIQLYTPAFDGSTIDEVDGLLQHLLVQDRERLVFLLGLALSLDVVEIQSTRLYVKRAEARRWLALPRAAQVKDLAESWQCSRVYHDLWHVPGLVVERAAGTMSQYDPSGARGAFIEVVSNLVPRQGWWSQDSFIDAVKRDEPEFQRPNGDFNSWYIRSESGEYLQGMESWDSVDGALLYYYLTGPMHWLGLLDSADDASRFTVYGRAFLTGKEWPTPPEPSERITIKDDGSLLVTRKSSRIDRFQIARFATWMSAGDPYVYRLDGTSIGRAGEQGINVGQITAFLTKANGDAPLPASVTRLLENWQGGASASVTVEQMLVLRTTASESLDFIFDTPTLRRYLGARLGPMAVVVRPDQWEGLRSALADHGIEAELLS
jgi:Helicase conserved C-terminal domain